MSFKRRNIWTKMISRLSYICVMLTANLLSASASEFAPVQPCFVGSRDCVGWIIVSNGSNARNAMQDGIDYLDENASLVFPLVNETFEVTVGPEGRGSSPVDVIFLEKDQMAESGVLLVRLGETNQAYLCVDRPRPHEEILLLRWQEEAVLKRMCHKMALYESHLNKFQKSLGEECKLQAKVFHDRGEVNIVRVNKREVLNVTVFYWLDITHFIVKAPGVIHMPVPRLHLTEDRVIVSARQPILKSQYVCVSVSGVVDAKVNESLEDSLIFSVSGSRKGPSVPMQRCRKRSGPAVQYFASLDNVKNQYFQIHLRCVSSCPLHVYITKISSCHCKLPDLKRRSMEKRNKTEGLSGAITSNVTSGVILKLNGATTLQVDEEISRGKKDVQTSTSLLLLKTKAFTATPQVKDDSNIAHAKTSASTPSVTLKTAILTVEELSIDMQSQTYTTSVEERISVAKTTQIEEESSPSDMKTPDTVASVALENKSTSSTEISSTSIDIQSTTNTTPVEEEGLIDKTTRFMEGSSPNDTQESDPIETTLETEFTTSAEELSTSTDIQSTTYTTPIEEENLINKAT